jgi:hypothetical protein
LWASNYSGCDGVASGSSPDGCDFLRVALSPSPLGKFAVHAYLLHVELFVVLVHAFSRENEVTPLEAGSAFRRAVACQARWKVWKWQAGCPLSGALGTVETLRPRGNPMGSVRHAAPWSATRCGSRDRPRAASASEGFSVPCRIGVKVRSAEGAPAARARGCLDRPGALTGCMPRRPGPRPPHPSGDHLTPQAARLHHRGDGA